MILEVFKSNCLLFRIFRILQITWVTETLSVQQNIRQEDLTISALFEIQLTALLRSPVQGHF